MSPEGHRLPHVSRWAASSNFVSAAVLDISRKATAVKERADFIGTLHFLYTKSTSLQLQALLHYFGKNRTHDFRTTINSRCATHLLDHSGDERLQEAILHE